MTSKAYFRLTKPDKHGNYWLGRRDGDLHAPAIFPSKFLRITKEEKVVIARDSYIATMGIDAEGVLMDGPSLMRFRNPNEALAEINRRIA